MAMPPVFDEVEAGLSLILAPVRVEDEGELQVAYELSTPPLDDFAQILSDLSLLATVLYDHTEDRSAIERAQPEIAYLRMNTPAILVAIAKGAKPSTWVDELGELVGAIWAFPSTVKAARDERRARAANASNAVKQALEDPRLDGMLDRRGSVAFVVLQVQPGEPQELIEVARSGG